mmetsp:Transcript_31249/g.81402  ORF Transcript_31249/g.81402 Transcript_31249/m.81402 type:complete len:564 (-) Transcript_31249:115-1806(-)
MAGAVHGRAAATPAPGKSRTVGVKVVTTGARTGKWEARQGFPSAAGSTQMALVGYFNTAEEAMRARDCAAMVVPAAMLNYPASSYTMGQVLSVVRHMVSSWPPRRAAEILQVCEVNATRLGVQPDRTEPPLPCLNLLRRRSQDRVLSLTLKVVHNVGPERASLVSAHITVLREPSGKKKPQQQVARTPGRSPGQGRSQHAAVGSQADLASKAAMSSQAAALIEKAQHDLRQQQQSAQMDPLQQLQALNLPGLGPTQQPQLDLSKLGLETSLESISQDWINSLNSLTSLTSPTPQSSTGMDALSASLKGLTSTEHAADANLLPDKQATSLGGLELSAGLSSLPGLAEALGAAAAAAAAGSAGGPQELPALSTMGSQQQQQQQQAQEQGGDSITAGGAIKQDNAAALPSPSRGPGRGVVGGGVGDASINAEAISGDAAATAGKAGSMLPGLAGTPPPIPSPSVSMPTPSASKAGHSEAQAGGSTVTTPRGGAATATAAAGAGVVLGLEKPAGPKRGRPSKEELARRERYQAALEQQQQQRRRELREQREQREREQLLLQQQQQQQ